MKAIVVTAADLRACPKLSMSARHYREDGSCRCNERAAIEREIERVEAEIAQRQILLRCLREDLSAT